MRGVSLRCLLAQNPFFGWNFRSCLPQNVPYLVVACHLDGFLHGTFSKLHKSLASSRSPSFCRFLHPNKATFLPSRPPNYTILPNLLHLHLYLHLISAIMACSMPYSQCRRHEKSRQKLKRFLFQRQQYSARQSTGDTLSSWKRATLAAARDTWPDSQNNLERQPREVDGDCRPRSNFQLRDGLAFAEAARKYRSGFSTPAFAHTTTSLNKRTNTDPSADNAESESSTARQIHRPDTPSVTRTSSRNPRNGERQTPDASATISTKDEVAPLQQEAPLATPATTHVVTANARPLHTDNLNWPVAHGITLTAGEERQNTKPGRKISQKRRRDVSHFPADQDLDPEVSPPRKQVRFDAEGGSLLSDTSASSCDLRTRTPSDEEEGPTPTLTPTNHEPGVTAKAIYFVNAPLGRDRDRTLKTRARPEYTLDQSPRRRKRPAEIHPEHLRAIIGNEKGEELLLGLTDICERVILFGDELEILVSSLPGKACAYDRTIILLTT